MERTYLVPTVQAAGSSDGVRNVFLAHFGPVISINNHLNATDYLKIVTDHVNPFMPTCYPSSNSLPIFWSFQHHVNFTKQMQSQTGFRNMTMSSVVLHWPSQSLDLNPVAHLGDLGKICRNHVM